MKYFKQEEFDSPDSKGSGILMSTIFLDKLDKARGIYNAPIIINSGYRTIAHNKAVGGSPTSSHLKGLAADLRCTSSLDRYRLISALLAVGIYRFGIDSTFIHCDIDSSKPACIWTYPIKH